MSDDLKVIAELRESGVEVFEAENEEDKRSFWRERKSFYTLEALKVIDIVIRNIHIDKILPYILKLTHLQELHLDNNQIQEIPESLAQLKNLKKLSLWKNQIKEIPEFLAQLTHLQELSLWNNQIQEIPESLAQLKNLKRLFLWDNQIKEIPKSLAQLTHLRYLYLSDNQIKEIPESLAQLTNLKELWLRGNQIKEIPEFLSQLTHLERLILSDNQIKEIPESLAQLTNLKYLGLRGNQLPKIIHEDNEPQKIIEYLLRFQRAEKLPMNEAKILVVGDERVGKSSLIKRLSQDRFDENEQSTKGVTISSWLVKKEQDTINNETKTLWCDIQKLCGIDEKFQKKDETIDEIQVNIWDFAGQEVTHTPHQYFMTKQSLYLLVIDAQVEDAKSRHTINYWLDMIKSYAGEDVPIIIVANKIDNNKGYRFDFNRYKEQYPNIVDEVFYLSCQEGGDKFDELKAFINVEVQKLESVNTPFPKDYHHIKRKMEELEQEYIEDRAFFEICEEHNVMQKEEQQNLLALFNAMGTVVSYNIKNLKQTFVINPEWVTNGIYDIIRSKVTIIKKGILAIEDLGDILDKHRYEERQYEWFFNLMERFEVAFHLDDEHILIPSVLESNKPKLDFSTYDSGLRLRIKFDFLPKSVISRFIIKSRYYHKNQEYWRDGVELSYDGIDGIVVANDDSKHNHIDVYILNDDKKGRDFLNIIRHDLRTICENKLIYHELVPLYMPQHKGQFEKYQKLLKLEKRGVNKNWFGGNDEVDSEEYEISRLLDGYSINENQAKVDKFIVMYKDSSDLQMKELVKEAQEAKSQGFDFGNKLESFNRASDFANNAYNLIEKISQFI